MVPGVPCRHCGPLPITGPRLPGGRCSSRPKTVRHLRHRSHHKNLRLTTFVPDVSDGSTGGVGGSHPPPPRWNTFFSFFPFNFNSTVHPTPQPPFTPPFECQPTLRPATTGHQLSLLRCRDNFYRLSLLNATD